MITIDAACPYCKTPLNRTFEIGSDAEPQTGDASFCGHCGRWSIFELEGTMRLRKPTQRELIEIAEDPACRATAFAWMRA